MRLVYLGEGFRFFKRALKTSLVGYEKYSGNINDFCLDTTKDCFNRKKRFFMVSNSNFPEFYSRDFGWCTSSLIKLGYKEKVKQTLNYALEIFSKKGGICVAISPNNVAFNFPDVYSIDSTAYLFHSLSLLNDKVLIKKYKNFLNTELKRFFETAIDRETGLVAKGRFSSMKDHAVRESSCYDNVMVAVLDNVVKNIGILKNPLKEYNFQKILRDNFWTGSYFLDDLSARMNLTGDSNVYPFWFRIFESRKMLKSAVSSIQDSRLDRPFPLKYSNGKKGRFISQEIFVKNWQRNCIWPCMGFAYIDILGTVDKEMARMHLRQYVDIFNKYKNIFEVYSQNGKPYKSFFYHADDRMLWTCMLLKLLESEHYT
jgi:hypothetical protein